MNRVIRLLVATLGVFAGIGIFVGVISLLTAIGVVHEIPWLTGWMLVGAYFIAGVIGGLFFYIIYPKLEALVRKIGAVLDAQMSKIPTKDVVFASVGLIVGLIIALLLSTLINQIPIPWLSTPLSIVVYLVMAYLGVDVALKRKGELGSMTEAVAAKQSGERKQKASRQDRNVPPKILDTSAIIDGRIYDVAKTGIIDGRIVIPEFVLGELRHIADSSDSLRRQKGRRGLDILSQLQQEFPNVVVSDKDYEGIEVDEKLIRLASDMKGKIITNDLNLNKVATVKNVGVININALATAVKTPAMPGEILNTQIIREGKEAGQGLAYLDDGTMIVVDGGSKRIGQTVDVSISSVLQTGAGRMIFARVVA